MLKQENFKSEFYFLHFLDMWEKKIDHHQNCGHSRVQKAAQITNKNREPEPRKSAKDNEDRVTSGRLELNFPLMLIKNYSITNILKFLRKW